jgi:uncharacterized protein YeaO (DUF488 family)
MKRYNNTPSLLHRLRSLVRQGPLTLAYSARDKERNDAVELRHLILRTG